MEKQKVLGYTRAQKPDGWWLYYDENGKIEKKILYYRGKEIKRIQIRPLEEKFPWLKTKLH